MRLGEILVGQGLVSMAQIEAAAARQKLCGGRLGESLIALGALTAAQFDDVIRATPATPRSVAETAVPATLLINLMLKFMHVERQDNAADLAARLKLSQLVVQALLDDAVKRQYVQALGMGGGSQTRYGLSERGRTAAVEAVAQNLYFGPAPVPLAAFQQQVLRQRITNEITDAAALNSVFDGLVVPDHYLRKIGPAINAGRTVLLFGPPGNGKTTMATRVAKVFKQVVCVPYAIEVDGQIIKMFDSGLHKPAISETQQQALEAGSDLQREGFDQRWVACARPVVIAGGELNLEMLELQYNAESKFYEAPLHMKALNGVFLIDDFGRQQLTPEALLNRWIVPMESRFDYLKLNTGKSFQIPFDELLIFSTNLEPADLMDGAFLRRIPYKIKLFEPTREEYRRIFDAIAAHSGLVLEDAVFEYIVGLLAEKYGLAYYQPKFICDQTMEACKFDGVPPELTRARAGDALANLYVEIEDARG